MKKKYDSNGLFASFSDEKADMPHEEQKVAKPQAKERRLYTEQPVYVQSYSLLKQLVVL